MNYLDPAYYANARREISPLLPRGAHSVLEFGCSEGNTLAWLRAEHGYEDCRGVEIVGEAAARARAKGLDVAEIDIERESLPYTEAFDLVLCLDVLEHLNDPWDAMRNIREYVRPGGYFIASIPNVGHLTVVGDLLLRGRWDYVDSGVLDRTHLRFFTGQTAAELVTGAGLELVEQRGRIPRKTHRRLNVLTLGALRRLFVLQYLISAKRPG